MTEQPHSALDVDRIFVRAMNAHDLEAVMSTYDSSTVFVQGPGQENIVGLDNLRATVERFLDYSPKLTVELKQFVQADDIALFSVRWTLEGTDEQGDVVSMTSADSNVVRRRDDGTWFTLIDNPFHEEFLKIDGPFRP